jgi:uncharacterized protein (DUF2141 family)
MSPFPFQKTPPWLCLVELYLEVSVTKTQFLAPFLVLVNAALLAQSNPIPLIYQPLSPASVSPGHAGFTLRVRGTGFRSGAVVKWDGQPLSTTFLSDRTLKADVPAADVAKPGTGAVAVANPGTIVSNVIYLPVRRSSSTVTVATDPAVIESGEVVVGDFNNDSRPDLSVASVYPNSYVDTYTNQGKGNFSRKAGPAFWGAVLGTPFIAADFNGDGNLDAASCGSDGGTNGGCTIYFGDGKGGLTASTDFVGGGTMADVNGDGILDSVYVDFDGYFFYLAISLGNGDGTFHNVTYTQLNIQHSDGIAAVGDFNGDGKLDVAIPSIGTAIPGPGTVAVFLGNGDGTVQNEVDYQIPWGGTYASVADVNGDGKLDIVTSGASVLLGNGDGTFVSGWTFGLSSGQGSVPIGDLNGDGKLDVATISSDISGNQTLNVFFGNGDGSFANPITFPVAHGSYGLLSVADFNNDGRLDFAFGGFYSSTILIQTPAK